MYVIYILPLLYLSPHLTWSYTIASGDSEDPTSLDSDEVTVIPTTHSLPTHSAPHSLSHSSRRMRLLHKFLRNVPHRALRGEKRRKGLHHEKNKNIDIIPEIDCPIAEDGMKLFACPTPNEDGIYRCIDDHALCDNKIHCPNGEDENGTVCMFHKMTTNYFKILMDAIFGLTRSVI